jgi:hypothetical protein
MFKSNETKAPIYLAIAYFIAFTIPGICQYL